MSVIRRIANSVRERSNARQDNTDLGVLAGLQVNLYITRMLLHDDVVSDGQAEAGAFASEASFSVCTKRS